MVDLNGQYEAIKGEVDSALDSVLNTTSFINGPAVKEFQSNLQKYLSVRHVIPCANGTDALQIALMALDLKRGDEVITTNFSFASTIEVIILLGLKPVIVDIDPKTYNISIEALESKLKNARKNNTLPKVLVPVHFAGQPVHQEEIWKLSQIYNFKILEEGDHVLCAISGKQISIQDLTYWNVDLQEPYYSYVEASLKRDKSL